MINSPLSDLSIISNPYPTYEALSEKEPVHWCKELNAWALMRYVDCATSLKDPRLKAERMESILDLKFPNHNLPTDNIYHQFTKNTVMYTDNDKHDALRKSTNPGFTRDAHEHYSKIIEAVAFDLVKSIPQGCREIDAITELTAKLPINAAVHAFGLPEEDLAFVLPRVEMIMTYWSGPQLQPVTLNQIIDSLTELHIYSTELIEGKRGKVIPDTVIARLAAGQSSNIYSTIEQTIHQLVLLIIALFAPTTPGSVSSGILSFATHPNQIEVFLSDPSCLENVANEVVRFNASNQFTWRVTSEDLDIGGVQINKGQIVVPFLGAANRDHRVFENPHQFDLHRKNSAKNLSFGMGVHSCLGRQIASLEIRWFFIALFKRFPRIQLAGEPIWNSNLEFRSLKSLPLQLY